MIASMTGYGRGEYSEDNFSLTVDIRAVNHRFCDINARMPSFLMFMENSIKARVKKELIRGRIDIYINYNDEKEKEESLNYNAELAKKYLEIMRNVSNNLLVENDITVPGLINMPEVISFDKKMRNEEFFKEAVNNALEIALTRLKEVRQEEGKYLYEDLREKLQVLEEKLAYIEFISGDVEKEYRKRLEEKLQVYIDGGILEESRIDAELIIYLDKNSIDEEIVRLRSHVKLMDTTFKSNDGSVGKKLDFIAQEMNREANTILSKASKLDISISGIEIKNLIENIREQIQNII